MNLTIRTATALILAMLAAPLAAGAQPVGKGALFGRGESSVARARRA